MKKSYRIKFTNLQLVVECLLLLLLLVGFVLTLINLVTVSPDDNPVYWMDILSLVVILAITCLLLLVIFNSRYILSGDRLRLLFGFFGFSIAVKDMLMVRADKKRSLYLLYYNIRDKKTDEIKTAYIALNTAHAENLKDDLTELNKAIVFDIFTDETSTDSEQ